MSVLKGPITADSFELFFKDAEPRLHDALSACFGSELGREATADALAYGWEHWDRVASMENPIGYLFVVGRDRGRKARGRRRARLPLVEESRLLRRRDFDIPLSRRTLCRYQRRVAVNRTYLDRAHRALGEHITAVISAHVGAFDA